MQYFGLSGRGGQKCSCPHTPQTGKTKIYGKPCTLYLVAGNSNFNWVLKLNHLVNFFEVLYLVFACTCNEKDFKVIKFWTTFNTSVLYSIKSTRCGSMIYISMLAVFFPFYCTTIVSFAFHVSSKCTIYTYQKVFEV